MSLGAAASSVPWRSGRQHKEQVSRFGHTCPLVMLVRDRGHGQVSVDGDARTIVEYRMRDEVDLRSFHRGLVELARLLEAGGAAEVAAQDRDASTWRRGEPLEPFLERLAAASLRPFDLPMYSGHQMCSARMGSDPTTSVADPWGQLHDAPGVWIGDSSAFPTATGMNPMVTAMALARRTAEAMLA